MPQSYIFRMVAMDFRRLVSEAPIAIDADIKGGLTTEECQRLNRVKSSLHKYSRFTDALPPDEMDEKIQEEERRSQVNMWLLLACVYLAPYLRGALSREFCCFLVKTVYLY